MPLPCLLRFQQPWPSCRCPGIVPFQPSRHQDNWKISVVVTLPCSLAFALVSRIHALIPALPSAQHHSNIRSSNEPFLSISSGLAFRFPSCVRFPCILLALVPSRSFSLYLARTPALPALSFRPFFPSSFSPRRSSAFRPSLRHRLRWPSFQAALRFPRFRNLGICLAFLLPCLAFFLAFLPCRFLRPSCLRRSASSATLPWLSSASLRLAFVSGSAFVRFSHQAALLLTLSPSLQAFQPSLARRLLFLPCWPSCNLRPWQLNLTSSQPLLASALPRLALIQISAC